MVLPDDDPEKWVYTSATRQKHKILQAYLWPWLSKISSWADKIRVFDCFAGRGAYFKGEKGIELHHLNAPVDRPGSPLLILDTVASQKERFEELDLVCIEDNLHNFSDLEDLFGRTSGIPDNIHVIPIHGRFEEEISNSIEQTGGKKYPSFFFIDPFGFKGLRYDVIKEITPIKGFEFLITFMSRDMNRFLSSPRHEEVLSDVFGKPIADIKKEIEEYSAKKWEPLVEYYSNILETKMGVSHTIAYKMCEPGSRKTLYYLVFGTNHIAGLNLMKEILYRQGVKGRFLFTKKGKYASIPLDVIFGEDLSPLKDRLLQRFEGQVTSYKWLKNEMAGETKYNYIDKHFRRAIIELEKEKKVQIIRRGIRRRGGLMNGDFIAFRPKKASRR